MKDFYGNTKLWRYLTYFWTVLIFLAVIHDFRTNNAHITYLGPLAALYAGVLGMYSADKEFQRWHHISRNRHPGEVFVLLWTLLLVSILVLDLILMKSYVLPSSIVTTYIFVLGVLAVTKQSKRLYLEHCVVDGLKKTEEKIKSNAAKIEEEAKRDQEGDRLATEREVPWPERSGTLG